MTVIKRWIAMSKENYHNSHIAEQQLSLLTPVVLNLQTADQKWYTKNTGSSANRFQVKPFYDDRYKHEFKLCNLGQITTGSIKHRIWIGDIQPKFNPKHEGHIARLEYTLKREFVRELAKDECLTQQQKERYQYVGFTLIDVFGKTIFNAMVGEYDV
ncbi:MAG: hypothetical protein CMP53_09065 [Flavobacteriales bacterium]|nr:hypothetical protein [Flavobacteriales bacterium]|tara:strand:- start:1005 stop:1475 length:471 start_codon:yes stop_codon:yes gene_type:complete